MRRITQGASEVSNVYSQRLITLALIEQDLSGPRLTELGEKETLQVWGTGRSYSRDQAAGLRDRVCVQRKTRRRSRLKLLV